VKAPLSNRRVALALCGLALELATRSAQAQLIVAEPEAPIEVLAPSDTPAMEVQVVTELVIDVSGQVESAVIASHTPADAPPAFDAAALSAVRHATFRPSTRDGQPFRSRVEYVVVFHAPEPVAAPAPPAPEPTPAVPATAARPQSPAPEAALAPPDSAEAAESSGAKPLSTNEPDEDYERVIEVRGTSWPSPRGIGDLRIKRELLDASPRQQTSELLSAAPGFFVDHEDGEGLGNDVYLRGFDLDHGSGIEMRVGNVPINSPVHVQGQGYADANFIIPEVVRSIRVLEGPYDPRQGDTAIVGSAYFDLGVKREHQLKVSYGSFNQERLVGIVAPTGFDDQTFLAFALGKTDGFGAHRASQSGTLNAQYGLDFGSQSHLRLLATAYGTRAHQAGVVRQTDVDAGRIGFYDSYPYYSQGQGVQSSRVIIAADFDSVVAGGARFEFAPWLTWTGFRERQNLSGNIYSSQLDPEAAGGTGDLWETANRESAFGLTSRLASAAQPLTSWLEANAEPGLSARIGHTDQTKSLLSPQTLSVWDRRLDAGLDTLDVGAYFDVDLRFFKRARLSGGVRADLLSVSITDRLGYDVPPAQTTPGSIPGATRATQGVAVGPRLTAEYEIVRALTASISYGEGFRSLGATANVATSAGIAGEGPSVQEGARPFSKVRSYEIGLRAKTPHERLTTTLALFETHVANELVFEATSGGFTTEGASVRRGAVASAIAKPFPWLLASLASSFSSATFTTLVPGVSHFVPNIPPFLFRADVSAHGELLAFRGAPLTGRVGVGYTFLEGRHLTDAIVGPSDHLLSAHAALRYDRLELGIEGYNLLGRHYADDREYYVSNWSLQPGTPLASSATHLSAAPPLTLLGTLALYL